MKIYRMFAILFALLALRAGGAATAGAPPEGDITLAPAATIISSDIITDTTWTSAGSPYQVTTVVNVSSGVTLTVTPGVEVQFVQNAGLTVHGKLVVTGTAGAPVLFTGVVKTPGSWRGIQAVGTAGAALTGSSLDYTNVEYGGFFSTGGNLYLEYATVNVTHSLFRWGGTHGIYGSIGGRAHISDSTFADNQGYAVLFGDGTVNAVLHNLSATGNITDAVGLSTGFSSSLVGTQVWENMGLPYVVRGNPTIAATATLTIEPGVPIQFMPNAGLTALGRLAAVGATNQPITLTGSVATPGSWRGVLIQGTAGTPNTGSVLDHVIVEYGGLPIGGSGNLALDHAVVTVTNSILRNGGKNGLVGAAGADARVSNSSFTGNAGYALLFNDATVDARLANLSATHNLTDAVGLAAHYDSNLTGTHTWEASGLTYEVSGVPVVAPGATLRVEPGVEVRFQPSSGLTVKGRLTARGTASQPITLTGTIAAPGSWLGIAVSGSPIEAAPGSALEYVTVAYGGSGPNGANVSAQYGQIAISRSILRDGGGDGFLALLGGAASRIESSQIVGNAHYGVRNTDSHATQVLLAPNNWWGAASGPIADSSCNPAGTGSRVSANVAFSPFLTSAGADPGPVAPSDARILSMTPQRWFAPADGVTRIWVTITLLDGNGQPLPGRTVGLQTTRGTAVGGGVTGLHGQSLAYVTSHTASDAELTAILISPGDCEAARSPSARVTFTPPYTGTNLMPDAAAPYLHNGIEVDPMPVVRGVPTTLRARLTNPNPFSITVDATFSYAQLGIGLLFGPVGEVHDYVIGPHSQGLIQVPWTPLVTAHFCVALDYTWLPVTGAGQIRMEQAASGGSGHQLRNFQPQPGPIGSPQKNDALDKADKAIRGVSMLPAGPTQIQKGLVSQWWKAMYESARSISKNLGGDPPRQDYRLLATMNRVSVPPVQPSNQVSAARAAAINAVTDAFVEVNAAGGAAVISLDRYGGAAAAQDLVWSSQQSAALIYYDRALGTALVNLADRLDAFLQVLQAEGESDWVVTPDDIRAYQAELLAQGLPAQEIDEYKAMGLSDTDIEAIRQERIAADPVASAGSYAAYVAAESSQVRSLGRILLDPWQSGGGLVGGGSGGLAGATSMAITSTNHLVRLFETTSTFQVGNPLTRAATIDLRVRRLELPADWAVVVTPKSVTLNPGEQTAVTATVQPGIATVQGTQLQVAIEGYASDQLMGGVVLGWMAPEAAYFDGKLRLYLPVIVRDH